MHPSSSSSSSSSTAIRFTQVAPDLQPSVQPWGREEGEGQTGSVGLLLCIIKLIQSVACLQIRTDVAQSLAITLNDDLGRRGDMLREAVKEIARVYLVKSVK